jgi:uncharacterized SAM-binding protein YcdF (DUF218 family)
VSAGRWRRRALVILVVVALGVGVATWSLARLGYWLIVDDPLTRAGAMVVLAGDFPFRAMEAAALYREGWAVEVWLASTRVVARDAALERLGLPPVGGEEEANRAVLIRLGVPAAAIRLVPGIAQRTADEVRLVAEELGRQRQDRVILVTSKAHTRRVRALWRRLAGAESRAIVHFAREDPFDPGRWWGNTRDALLVSREVLGLLNAWAGLPLGG